MLYQVIGILLVSWGKITTTVRAHVMQCQTVKPQRLRDSSLINVAATNQIYTDVLQYSLTITGQNYTLHWDKNKAFLFLHQMHLIEPLASLEAGQQDHCQSSQPYRGEGLYAELLLPSLKSSARTQDPSVKPRTVELVLVVDHSAYKKYNSKKTVETRMIEVANHVDKLYRPVGVRVMLVGLDIWSYRDEIEVSTSASLTLTRFLDWRQQKLMLRTKHDNAQFVTGVDFEGDTIGLASIGQICKSQSGGVNQDYSDHPIGLASVIAHELGHNMGLTHDTKNCVCGYTILTSNCIMAKNTGLVYPKFFSSCSKEQLRKFFKEVNPPCLLDTPSTDRIYGGPMCGNAFVESEEQCDCGTPKECKNTCCNARTCTLKAGAQCAEGGCCQNCKLKPAGSLCRLKTGDCDLTEYCTGLSADCPTDTYAQNGLACNGGNGYCYNGQCPSRQKHCKRLWGPDAEVAVDACFHYGNCRRLFMWTCKSRDTFCGTLFCSRGWQFPVTSNTLSFRVANGDVCKEAKINPEDNYPDNFGMVPTGTKCGDNMVCYNHKCQKIAYIHAFGPKNCSDKCNNQGVCNHIGECQCNRGWAPPFCDERQPELFQKSTAFIMTMVVCSVLLVALAVGSLVCFIKKRQPAQRCLQFLRIGKPNELSSANDSLRTH